MFPDFVQHTAGDASIWLDRRFADPLFIGRLADADGLLNDPACQIIKDQKKIKIGRLPVTISGTTRSIYVKRYNVFSWRYRIASPFSRSGALRALRGATILRRANIPTVVPVAAVEQRRGGVLSKSFFISEEIAHGLTADAYWQKELQPMAGAEGFRRRRRFLLSLAGIFRALHGQNVYHNDLKDANILAVANGGEIPESLFLLDLEGIRRCASLGDKRRIKNLVQLHRTLGRMARRTEKMAFIKGYLAGEFANRALKRRLVASVLRESDRVDRAKALFAETRAGGKKFSRA